MKILLDTGAYVCFKLNHPEIVEKIIGADQIIISQVVIGELLFGSRNGSRFSQNMKELDQFMSHQAVEFSAIGKATSDRYSSDCIPVQK